MAVEMSNNIKKTLQSVNTKTPILSTLAQKGDELVTLFIVLFSEELEVVRSIFWRIRSG